MAEILEVSLPNMDEQIQQVLDIGHAAMRDICNNIIATPGHALTRAQLARLLITAIWDREGIE